MNLIRINVNVGVLYDRVINESAFNLEVRSNDQIWCLCTAGAVAVEATSEVTSPSTTAELHAREVSES